MMRRSGSRPAVKRWKLCCEMLRRAASGHIEATQFSKFAAAWRIALAVISGWPEAPSSPLQGGAALLAAGTGCACADALGRWPDGAAWLPFKGEPLKMLSKKPKGPPLDGCAQASPDSSSAAAIMAAPVRLLANSLVRRVMSHPTLPEGYPVSGGLVAVSNSLTKARFGGCFLPFRHRVGTGLRALG